MEGARLEFLMGSRSTISYYRRGFESAQEGCVNVSKSWLMVVGHITQQSSPSPRPALLYRWVGLVVARLGGTRQIRCPLRPRKTNPFIPY